MSIPLRRLKLSSSYVVVLGSISVLVSGCVGDFVSPLAVASHRYPTVRQALAPSRTPPKVQLVADEPVTGERLPTAREIFDLHPPGSDPERMRQPFLLNPNEGPLRISTLSRDDVAAADKLRAGETEAARRTAALRPTSLNTAPTSLSVPPITASKPAPATALVHQ